MSSSVTFSALTDEDKHIIDTVIDRLGAMTKREIVALMHREKAYAATAQGDVIQFKYAESLQI